MEAEIGYVIDDGGGVSRLGKIGKASIEDWFPYREWEAQGGSETIGTHDRSAFSFKITEINFSDACGLPGPTTSMTRYLNAKKLNDQYR